MGKPKTAVIPSINDKELTERRHKLRPMVRIDGAAPSSHAGSVPTVNVDGKGDLYILVPGNPRHPYHDCGLEKEVPAAMARQVGRQRQIFLPFEADKLLPAPSEALVLAQLPKRLPKTANAYEVRLNRKKDFRRQGNESYWCAILIFYHIAPPG